MVRRAAAVGLTLAGCLLLILSLGRTWWGLLMYAPQFPQGLEVGATLTRVVGQVEQIDSLNHYIGMMPLAEAAKWERRLAPYAVYGFALLAAAALLVRQRWLAWLLRIPLISFPLVFLADLKYWLWYAGNHLDPRAALSTTVKPFTPTMLGPGKIAQFQTYGWVETGFWMATAGALCVLAGGLLLSRRFRTPEV